MWASLAANASASTSSCVVFFENKPPSWAFSAAAFASSADASSADALRRDSSAVALVAFAIRHASTALDLALSITPFPADVRSFPHHPLHGSGTSTSRHHSRAGASKRGRIGTGEEGETGAEI